MLVAIARRAEQSIAFMSLPSDNILDEVATSADVRYKFERAIVRLASSAEGRNVVLADAEVVRQLPLGQPPLLAHGLEAEIAHGLKGPTSSLGFRDRVERLGELAKLVKAASEGTPQIIGKYEPDRAESLSAELRQAGATVEIRPPKLSPPVDHGNQAESAVTKLKQLAELREAGIVTEQEFESKKAELLSQL